ncbi:MAG: hypothetical protein AAF547_05555 [Actinomycetota bacterium]
MSEHTLRPPGRSLRETVLQAAMQILDSDGLLLGAESISYAKVFAHLEETYGARVTRGSVHERIWASHDDFRREVLAEAVALYPEDYVLAVGRGLEATKELARSDLPPERMVGELSRRLAPILIEEMLDSPDVKRIQSVKAMASRFNDPETFDQLSGMLRARSDERLAARRSGFQLMAQALGFGPRATLGLSTDEASDLFYSSMWALTTGGFLNASAGCDAVLEPVDSDLGVPGDQGWNVLGVGLRAVIDFLVEPTGQPVDRTTMEAVGSVSAGLSSGEYVRPAQLVDPSGLDGGRRSRSELKQLVLGGAVEMLMRDGLNLRPESLSYAAVFAKVKEDHGLVVNRASVHRRFWSSHEEFCLEVLALALLADAPPDDAIEEALTPPAAVRGDRPPDRVVVVRDLMRAFGQASLDQVVNSPVMRRRLLIKACLAEQPDGRAKDLVCDAVVTTDRAMMARRAALVGSALIANGYQVRPELHLAENDALGIMAALIHTAVSGIAFDVVCGSSLGGPVVDLGDGQSGTTTSWSTISVITLAVFDSLFRPKD